MPIRTPVVVTSLRPSLLLVMPKSTAVAVPLDLIRMFSFQAYYTRFTDIAPT
ncbi:hypothetical protein [Streptomyces sp. NPDC048111]|uniref:hypothetical protein n=1 Tax=Streptomyces sp. NPDC048111 TaxID=3365500 RepID=UPI003720B7D8